MTEHVQDRQAPRRKLLTMDRALLVGVLVLQTLILVRVFGPTPSGTPPREAGGAEPAGDVPDRAQLAPASRAGVAPQALRTDPRLESAFFGRAQAIHNEMNRMFEEAVGDMERMCALMNVEESWESLRASPAMDMRERQNSYVVVFSLPGVHAPGVDVTLDGRLLTVQAPLRTAPWHGGRVHMFEKRVLFPGPIGDGQRASAFFTNGILRVEVPKMPAAELSPQPVHLF